MLNKKVKLTNWKFWRVKCDVIAIKRKYASGILGWRIFIAVVISLSTYINSTTSARARTEHLPVVWLVKLLLFHVDLVTTCSSLSEFRLPSLLCDGNVSVTAPLVYRLAIHQAARPAALRAAWQRRGDGGEKVWWQFNRTGEPQQQQQLQQQFPLLADWRNVAPRGSPRSRADKAMRRRCLSAQPLPPTRCWSKDQGRR